MGASALRAASRHALTPEDVTQLTAGIAYLRAASRSEPRQIRIGCQEQQLGGSATALRAAHPFSLASLSRSIRAWPVTTPGCTDGGSLGYDGRSHSPTHGMPMSSALPTAHANQMSECGRSRRQQLAPEVHDADHTRSAHRDRPRARRHRHMERAGRAEKDC